MNNAITCDCCKAYLLTPPYATIVDLIQFILLQVCLCLLSYVCLVPIRLKRMRKHR
jgi:hypothetical protein